MAYEALIVMHVLHMLNRGELDDIHVHIVGVTMRRRQRPISSRLNVGMVAQVQLLKSGGDIIKLTSFHLVFIYLQLIF